MNSDEFSIEQLTRKGLEYDDKTQTSDDFVIVDRYGGAYWRVDWLEAGSVYAYHKNASLSNIAEVMQMEQITIDEIVRIFESGGKPFKTIK